jgi:tRNA G18 (ribose-2'-O)-methylase SpoU
VRVEEITDAHDPRLADYVDLRDPVARRRIEGDELLIAEGVNVVRRLVVSPLRVRSVLVTPKRFGLLQADLAAVDAPVYVAAPEVMATTVGFDLHRGAVAAADRPPTLDPLSLTTQRTIAVLEGVNDHENLGAIARSARALGVAALVLDPTCADPYYRRAVRVSMGEMLHLPVARADRWPGVLIDLRAAGVTVAALTPATDAVDIRRWQRPEGPLAILLGAEGPGLTPAAQRAADVRLRIPIDPAVDSLNVGHAAAIAFAVLR